MTGCEKVINFEFIIYKGKQADVNVVEKRIEKYVCPSLLLLFLPHIDERTYTCVVAIKPVVN